MAAAVQSIEVDVPPQILLDVIVDYERYPEFLPDMESARIVRRDGQECDVEFALNIVTRIQYVLRLKADPPVGLSWTLVEGTFRKNDGGWTLEELPGGRTRATYRIDVEVGMFVPAAIVNRLVGKTLPATLRAFKQRAEQLAEA